HRPSAAPPPASTHPTATLSSQNPGARTSATKRSSAATSQTCHADTDSIPPERLEGIARTPRQRPATLAASGLSNTPGGGSLKRLPTTVVSPCASPYSPREASCNYPAWPFPSAYSARCSGPSTAPSPSSPSGIPSPATTSPC